MVATRKPALPNKADGKHLLRVSIRKKYKIPAYMFTDTLSTWCSPKHVLERIPSDVILEKSCSFLWLVYLKALQDLSEEDSYSKELKIYLCQCHSYLQQKKTKTTFEQMYTKCKQTFLDAEMDKRVKRARSRVEKEGELFGADLTQRGINQHRNQVQEANQRTSLRDEEQVNSNRDGSDFQSSTNENSRPSIELNSDEESIDICQEPVKDPFQDSDKEEDDQDELRLVRYNKVYHIQTPGKNLLSPHKPKLQELDTSLLSKHFSIRISSTKKGQADEETEALYQEYMEAGRLNESLKKLDKVFGFVTEALQQSQDGFCKWIWNQEPQSNDDKFIEMIKYIMTDFHLNCMSKKTSINDERTPFVENVVPPFKAYAKVMDALNFVWCERALSARKFVFFRTAESITKKADGIGRIPGTEHDILLIESSGSNVTENVQHSMDDTLKQLESTSCALKQQINMFKSASYDTMKKRKSYGIQVIQSTVTLTETSILSPTKWRFVELRSAVIPVTWDKRYQIIKLFELVATLHTLILEQAEVTEQLEAEMNGIVEVKGSNTVLSKFSLEGGHAAQQ